MKKTEREKGENEGGRKSVGMVSGTHCAVAATQTDTEKCCMLRGTSKSHLHLNLLCKGFSMLSHQVNHEIHVTTVLERCSTEPMNDLLFGQLGWDSLVLTFELFQELKDPVK